MQQLGLNREQVVRLVRVGVLPVVGSHGRTQLLDAGVVTALGSRAHLPHAVQGRLVALAAHLGPLDLDPNSAANMRHVFGWDVHAPVPLSAWEGWWNTGAAIADDVCGLPLLLSVSGFVVAVRGIAGWTPHPSKPGFVRFRTHPAETTAQQRYANKRFRAEPGTSWQRIYD